MNNFDAMEAILAVARAGRRRHLRRRREVPRGARAASRSRRPNGTITLDENRNAIGNNYLVAVGKTRRRRLGLKTLKTIPEVDQTFGGAFSADYADP